MTTPTMLNEDFEKIIVFDVWARFGIHPSWSSLKNSNLLATYAFDPDVNEVKKPYPDMHKFSESDFLNPA